MADGPAARLTALVNESLSQAQSQRLKASLERDRPLGSDAWTTAIDRKLRLGYTLNPRGMPKKKAES